MTDNIIINDTIIADQIEDGDQIQVDGVYYENVALLDATDPDEVRVRAYSEDEGDLVTLELPYDYPVNLWSL